MTSLEANRAITPTELARHHGRDGAPCWVGYKGLVYDVSKSELFENGKHYWLTAGQDLTAHMPDAPHLENVLEPFPVMGRLAEEVVPMPETSTGVSKAAVSTPVDKPAAPKATSQKVGEATFEKEEALTRSVSRFVLRCASSFRFQSGQYIRLLVPDREGNLHKRSYSIANSARNGGQKLELMIEYRDGGLASQYLFEHCRPGDTLRFTGPHGKFLLPEGLLRKEIVAVTEGAGITSLRPLITDLIAHRRTFRKVTLILGAAYASQLLLDREWAALAAGHFNFEYIPVLLREQLHKGRRRTGRPEDILREKLQARGADQALYYLSGWPEVVQAQKDVLSEKSISKDLIFSERYT